MNLLDENIPLDQRDILRSWGVHCRVIGQDIGELSIGDDNIISLLHRLKLPTLFTRDEDFFKSELCHSGYALIWLDAAPAESAFIEESETMASLASPAKASTSGRILSFSESSRAVSLSPLPTKFRWRQMS